MSNTLAWKGLELSVYLQEYGVVYSYVNKEPVISEDDRNTLSVKVGIASWDCPSRKRAYRKRNVPPLRGRGWWRRDQDRSYRENPFFGLVRSLK